MPSLNLLLKIFHKFISFFVSITFLFQQISYSYAQTTPDAGAPAANQAGVYAAPNGVNVVDIVTPNSSGLSHNKFTDYNVPTDGIVLNNSVIAGASTLAGNIIGNPNLTPGNEASTILNEVTSTNRSVLAGATEVFGSAANVIVANPNGITCSGCGFINTPRATLTTGVPSLTGDVLDNLSVDGGVVDIDGTGLNNAGGAVQILARAIELNAQIQADDIELIAGRNDYNPQTDALTAKADDGSTKPSFSIDSSALGGMYANRIRLVGTEAGVGFRLAGDMAASVNDVTITNTGDIVINGNASSANNIDITTSDNGDIDLNGEISSDNDINLTTTDGGDVNISSTVTSDGNTNISSDNDVNITGDGIIESKGALTDIRSANQINNDAAAIVAHNDLTIGTSHLINDEGLIIAGGNLTIEGQTPATKINILDNISGSIESVNGNIDIDAVTLNNISAAQVATNTIMYWYDYETHLPPRWIPYIDDGHMTPEAYRQFWDRHSHHVFVANPDYIADIFAANGDNIENYRTSDGNYHFTVEQWESVRPTNGQEFLDQQHIWSMMSPDEAYIPPLGAHAGVGVVTDEIVSGSYQPAMISAQSGDVTIDISSVLNNDKSHIAAANDINITGTGSLNDISETLNKTVFVTTDYPIGGGNRQTGWGHGVGSANYSINDHDIIGTLSSRYAAGGDLNVTLSGDVVSKSSPTNELNEFEFGQVSTTIVRSTLATGNSANSIFLNSGTIKPSSNQNFKYETRFAFTDLGTFYGSDYFLTGVLGAGYDPNAVARRVGDAYIDSRIINEQILSNTGRKYLNLAFGSDSDQIRNLLDAGINQYATLNLTPFIALTEEQQASLTQDIVWYEEREIDGETLLVPQLYLAQLTLDNLADNNRSTTFSGENVAINAANINLTGARIVGDNNVFVTASQDITLESGVIEGNDVNLNATENIIISTGKTITGSDQDNMGTVKGLTSKIIAGNDLDITAGETALFVGSEVEAGNDLTVQANDIIVTSLQLDRRHKDREGKFDVDTHTIIHDASSFKSGGNSNFNATDNILINGSTVESDGDINLQATNGDIAITATKDTFYSHLKSSSTTATTLKDTHNKSSLTSNGGDVIITADNGNITIKASDLTADNDITLDATNGSVNLLVEKDRDFHSYVNESSNAVWQKMANIGHDDETVRHTTLTSGGNINITSAKGITVEYKATGDLDQDIAQLSQDPNLAWMADLKNDPSVDWVAVKEIHKKWHEEQEGLTGAASAVIAISVALLTMNPASGMAFASAGGSFVAGITSSTALGAAASAGIAALSSQLAVGIINNQGDLGGVLKEVTSEESLQRLVATMISAGVLDKVLATLDISNMIAKSAINAGTSASVESIVTGADFEEALVNNLKFAGANLIGAGLAEQIGDLQLGKFGSAISHAVVGCATGSITGSCAGGAIGAATAETITQLTIDNGLPDLVSQLSSGELSREEYFIKVNELAQDGAMYGQFAALGANILASDGDSEFVTSGNQTAVTATQNNSILHAAAGAAAVGGVALTIYDAYSAYQSNGGGEEGAKAALEVIAIDAAITFVSGGAVKIGGKLYPTAQEAFSAYIGSSKMVQDIGKAIVKKADVVVDNTTESIINGLNKVVDKKAATSYALRNSPGKVTGGKNLSYVKDVSNWFKGTQNNAALVPKQVAEKMAGKQYSSFDSFKKSFWRNVANDPELSKGFSARDIAVMKTSGKAPTAPLEQHLGKNSSYQLHHKTPINRGGGVYDFDNIVIVTPRYHKEILDKGYHYGR